MLFKKQRETRHYSQSDIICLKIAKGINTKHYPGTEEDIQCC